MNNPFKIGDIVKIKEPERELFEQAGYDYDVNKAYIVEKIESACIYIRRDRHSFLRGWYHHRFELVSGGSLVATNSSDYQIDTDLSDVDRDSISKYLEDIKNA